MKLLLTGKHGQVGWELLQTLPALGEVVALDVEEMNLADADAIRRTVQAIRPDIIINPAAYTAVDKAESEPALAHAVNGIAPAILAEEAKRLNAVLVHYSTDYVFDGTQPSPYTERDTPNPQNVYGRTKLAGEEAIRASGCKHLILRTSWVYGAHGGNFVKTVLRLAKDRDELRIVADQHGAPTWARDLAQATAAALLHWQKSGWDNTMTGLYHLTASGRTDWCRYAEEIVRLARQYDAALARKALTITPITTAEYPVPAKRPANSSLACAHISEVFGIRLPAWEASLANCMLQIYQADV